MDEQLREFARRRADGKCEYCRLPQAGHEEQFSIDHIIPSKHGGGDHADDLALCCLRCNLSKGTNLSGIDPITNAVVALFNPRTQSWAEHFRWNGPVIVGVTTIGGATVRVLGMNAPERVKLRQQLITEGLLKT